MINLLQEGPRIKFSRSLAFAVGVFACVWAFATRAQEITAIDFEGNPLGKVIPDGKVVSFDNKILGNVTADSLILDSKGKIIGGVVPQGVAVGNDVRPLGKVGTDGSIRSSSGQILGKTLPNGLVVNEYYDILGQVIFPGLVYNDEGKIAGRVTGDGAYSGLNGKPIGVVTPDGYAYRKVGKDYILDGRLISSRMVVSTNGDFIGSVVPGGQVTDFNSEVIGYIKANEYVFDNQNTVIGRVVNTSYAFDDNGSYIGLVSYNGTVIKDNNTIGKIRADGRVISNSGAIVGIAAGFSATATDINGRYMGNLNPDGVIVKAGTKLGQLGARGNVFDSDGNLIGRLSASGPIYDYKGAFVGHAIKSGVVISIDGTTIGYMIGDDAYNLSGQMMGSVLKNKAVFAAGGEFVGICGIASSMDYKGSKINLSPLGYVTSSTGELIGHLQGIDVFYNSVGGKYAYLNLSGQVVGAKGDNMGHISGQRFVTNSADKLQAAAIAAIAAVNAQGTALGLLNQDNLLLNKSFQQSGKVLPDGSAAVAGNSNYFPKIGQAYSAVLAQRFNGELLGYLNPSGQVVNLQGAKEGYALEQGLVSDNNGVIIGYLQDFSGAHDNKCVALGVVSSQGGVFNQRGVFVGKPLGNKMVISSSGAVLGALSSLVPIIDFNGQIIGYPTYSGKVYASNGDYVGCLDYLQNLYDADGNWLGSAVDYGSVIAFDGKIIGAAAFNGQIVDDKNMVIGYQQPDGTVNSVSGLPIGSMMKYRVAFDFDNKFLGYINRQGKVIDNERKGIVYVDYDGYVISDKAQIGYALYDFYLYGDNGEVVGIISRNGEAADFNGANLGRFDRGFVIKDEQVTARGARDYNLRDEQHLSIGRLDLNGEVSNRKGNKLGSINNDGKFTSSDGKIVAQATPLQYYRKILVKKPAVSDAAEQGVQAALDENGKIVGYVNADGSVVDEAGNVVGRLKDDGTVVNDKGKVIGQNAGAASTEKGQVLLDENGNVIGYVMPDGTIVDEDGEVIGKRGANGVIRDVNEKVLGKVDANGNIIDDSGAIIGRQTAVDQISKATQDIMNQLERRWYERGQISSEGSKAEETTRDSGGVVLKSGNQYLSSLGIALTPDGEYLGEILENDQVVNDDGDVIGYRMPDGTIMDDDGNLIGVAEAADIDPQKIADKTSEGKKDVFIPAGTFGPGGAYGIGNGSAGNLGPGGGYGPGERYDPTRKAALDAAMNQRRGSIAVGKISSGIRAEAFTGYQKDWGMSKTYSTWRVDMSEMILADKPIPAVIARAIDAANPAPVTAYVERNVYAEEGRNIIIPAGSRLIGNFSGISGPSEATSDAARVQIQWQRLIRPDGSMFQFNGMTADAQGRAGALGYADQQLLKKYTLPVLTTVLSSTAAYFVATAEDNSSGETETSKQQAASDARQNFLEDMKNIFNEILQDKTDVQAQIYIPNGTRIIIYPNEDLWLRSFENDKEAQSSGNPIGSSNSHGLIDVDVTHTSANVKPGEKVYGPGGPTSTIGGDSSSVVYKPDNAGVQAVSSSSTPLIDTPTTQKRVAPPPPPSYGQTGSTAQTSSGAGVTSSSSSSSADDGVPSLF
ncbi:MAG: hypothetical protein IJ184_05860 [Alphaproteobacteria bacterium]|nr:hypothetical protein [Alphaproteobacteria bacterium]